MTATQPIRRRRPKPSERGFTLLEVFISVVIFVAGFAGVLSLQLTAARHVRLTNDTSMASNLASDTLERLRVTEYDAIPNTVTRDYKRHGEEGSSGDFFAVTTEATEHISGQYKDVAVTTSWDYQGNTREVQVRSRIVRPLQ